MNYRVQPTTLHHGPGFFIVDGATDQQVPGTGFYTLAGERDARNLCGQLNAAYAAGAATAPKLTDSALTDLRAFLRLRITTTQMYGKDFNRLELAHNDVWVLQELVERVAAREQQLVAAAREVIRTELFFQDHPQKFAAQKALRAALAPFGGTGSDA